jgi:hypothetical protein
MLDNSYWFPTMSWQNPQNDKSNKIIVCGTYFTPSDTGVSRHEDYYNLQYISTDSADFRCLVTPYFHVSDFSVSYIFEI